MMYSKLYLLDCTILGSMHRESKTCLNVNWRTRDNKTTIRQVI